MEKEKAPLRVGLMGFGQIGRMIYQIAADSGEGLRAGPVASLPLVGRSQEGPAASCHGQGSS